MEAVRETTTLIAADKVQGTDVFNNGGDRLGSVHDMMIDKQTGQVAYAILSFGGFLGVGSSYHPLPWSLLRYNTNLGGYVVEIDESRLEGAPSYPVGTDPAWGDPEYESKLHDYYGVDSLPEHSRPALTLFRVVRHWGRCTPDGQTRRRFIPPPCFLCAPALTLQTAAGTAVACFRGPPLSPWAPQAAGARGPADHRRFNRERIVARPWPAKEGHMTILELTGWRAARPECGGPRRALDPQGERRKGPRPHRP